jgi:hypothetical protein
MIAKLTGVPQPTPTPGAPTGTAVPLANTTSTITTTKSSLQTSTAAPIISSTRDNGFLDQAVGMKSALETAGWKLSDEKLVNTEKLREATYDKGGVHREFVITQKEMRTHDADVETFKMMLKCFQESHTVMPTITTTSQELKDKWVTAFKEVYPAKAQEADKLVIVKPDAPAIDHTAKATPATPDPPTSPRPR